MSECEHNSLSETGRDSHFIKGSSTYHYIEHICDLDEFLRFSLYIS